MKFTIRDLGVLLVVIINLAAIFYWGGSTRSRVDSQGQTMQYFMRRADAQHVEFQDAITELTVRAGVLEAQHEEE